MIEKIPPGWYGLVKVDPSTGVPLDVNGNWAIGLSNAHFLLFENLDEAKKVAMAECERDPHSEWVISDHYNKTHGHFRPALLPESEWPAALGTMREASKTNKLRMLLRWFKSVFLKK